MAAALPLRLDECVEPTAGRLGVQQGHGGPTPHLALRSPSVTVVARGPSTSSSLSGCSVLRLDCPGRSGLAAFAVQPSPRSTAATQPARARAMERPPTRPSCADTRPQRSAARCTAAKLCLLGHRSCEIQRWPRAQARAGSSSSGGMQVHPVEPASEPGACEWQSQAGRAALRRVRQWRMRDSDRHPRT